LEKVKKLQKSFIITGTIEKSVDTDEFALFFDSVYQYKIIDNRPPVSLAGKARGMALLIYVRILFEVPIAFCHVVRKIGRGNRSPQLILNV
jgi:hypothetical protein